MKALLPTICKFTPDLKAVKNSQDTVFNRQILLALCLRVSRCNWCTGKTQTRYLEDVHQYVSISLLLVARGWT